MEVDEKQEEKKEEKKEEPTFEILQNPCRVVRPQLNVVNLEEANKYKTIKDISKILQQKFKNCPKIYDFLKFGIFVQKWRFYYFFLQILPGIGGIIMVKRIDGGDESEAIVEPVNIEKAKVETEDEPEPPEPFEYTE